MVRYKQAAIDISSSMLVYTDKRALRRHHFEWDSIKKFIYIGFAFSSSLSNFDIFSSVSQNVRFIDFLTFEITLGMAYMFMDFFIRQYTKSIDFNNKLNPLLKAVTIGALLQTSLWALLHACDLADSIRYLFNTLMNLKTEPIWSRCTKGSGNSTCVSAKELLHKCADREVTNWNSTSASFYYKQSFSHLDKNVLTIRFFLTALVWLFNFFCTTVTTDTLVKFFRLSFLWRLYSTLVVVILIVMSLFVRQQDAVKAFGQLLNVTAPSTFQNAVEHVSYVYGIGFIGVYDFGTMSPYTMVDNAVVIFMIVFTVIAFARSFIVRVMYLVLTRCVKVEISFTQHYLMFAILPMSSEFFYGHKLYIIYIYINLLLATNAYLAVITLSMARLLHNEFRSVKNMYIVGLICFMGFSLSVPIIIQSMFSASRHQGLIYGLKVTVLYLGGIKVAIVMWMYGLRRFSTDIHFWLGFKPTKFWTICWIFLPVVLFAFFINGLIKILYMRDFAKALTAGLWIIFSLLAVALFHIKTMLSYFFRNDFAGVFTRSPKYGPPEREERKNRDEFNETIQLRRCVHNCNVIDDTFDCNHLPLTQAKSKANLESGSESSTSDINDLKDDSKQTTLDSIATK